MMMKVNDAQRQCYMMLDVKVKWYIIRC